MIEKSKRIVGLIRTTSGLSPTEMTKINLNDYKVANRQVFSTMGFKFIWGLTEDGEIIEFVRGGAIRKKDLTLMKEMGVIEAVTSGCWAPEHWDVDGERKETSRSLEIGKSTKNLFDRWSKALGKTGTPQITKDGSCIYR